MGMHRTQRAHSAVHYVTRNLQCGVALLFYKWSTCKGPLHSPHKMNERVKKSTMNSDSVVF